MVRGADDRSRQGVEREVESHLSRRGVRCDRELWGVECVDHEDVPVGHVTSRRGGASVAGPVVGRASTRAEADAGPAPADVRDLGLVLRAVPGGSQVVRVRENSAAEAGGVIDGDVIHTVGRDREPSPARIQQVWDALPEGGSLFLGVERDGRPRVVVLGK